MSDQPTKHPFGRRAVPEVQAPDEKEVWDHSGQLLEESFDTTVPPEPRPKKRSRFARSGVVRLLSFLLTMVFLGTIAFGGLIWYGKNEFEKPGLLAKAETVVVPSGATFTSIVPELVAKKIIPEQNVLRIFTRGIQASGKASALKAGEFGFEPGMSMKQVMLQLTDGTPITYSVTLPEGLTSYQIIQRIAADEVLVGDTPTVPPEGSLMPNTYSYQRGTTREEVVRRMRTAQEKALKEIWESRVDGLPLKSPEDLVILASIVEKETGVGSERPHVASVFINRLRKGQKLQTDPTIIYGIWGGQGKPKGRGGLRRSEIDKKTPYNTYQIDGLPPTPIANPGLASMQAVAKPLETDDFYFVADGSGGHAFAKTLDEHNANVAKWRKIETERKKASAQKEQTN